MASGRAEALPGGSGGHHHEHCGLAAAPSRLSHLAIPGAGPCLHASSLGSVLTLHVAVRAANRTVLSYAPKQSPPAFVV